MEALTESEDGESGFTLIEILVSFAILVAAIAVLQSGFGGGWRGIRASNMEAEALEIARAKLATVGVEAPLEAGATEGDAGGGFSWRIVVEPHGGSLASETPGEALKAPQGFWTTAQVRWNDGRSQKSREIALTTLKIKRPAGNAE